MKWLILTLLVACAGHPGKNEVFAEHGRDSKDPDWKAHITKATFDGKLVVLELGPRIHVVITRCYAHAQQVIGDHDHVASSISRTARPSTSSLRCGPSSRTGRSWKPRSTPTSRTSLLS